MKHIPIKINTKTILADTFTPISIYLRLRDSFANALLLESSDYHTAENSYSFIALQPLAEIIIADNKAEIELPNGDKVTHEIKENKEAITILEDFFLLFKPDKDISYNGLYGYTGYDAVNYFDTLDLKNKLNSESEIPQIRYAFYKFIIAINHFNNELTIVENQLNGQSEIESIISILNNKNSPKFQFQTLGNEESNYTDEEFLELVEKAKNHCHQGDVIQMVLSRQFKQAFKGDEINLYRALRSINPSPYLFYFDYGSYKIFGSSPETQLIIKDNKSYINPIAGTYRRTGDDETDRQLAEKLSKDPKEIAEHLMLVDLARNDLSRNARNIEVEKMTEVQFYSHVIHLVSQVKGDISEDTNIFQVFADTFPAGTLSGAPKFMAMQLIDKYENQARGYYGGAIGLIGFNRSINHAIMIRTFLSKNNKLFSQAGAGIVSESVPEKELKEVNNKLAALKKAIELAEKL